ncbi:MAG TPA: hypothetical protein VMD79_07410 [Solirubrobacteraceae bacterium]|nr:hypothetical protein [Solirubrobacteraceae bacterium]
MSSTSTAQPGRVIRVASGVESTEQPASVRDRRHRALAVFLGRWINEGHTIATGRVPSLPILTSDVYDLAPGGFFVVHAAYGKIGETSVGGVEIIGVDGDAYLSTLYDSFGNVHSSRVEIEGDAIRWIGARTRCTATITDAGRTQIARHEASADGTTFTPSMDVTLRKVE